jgi:uncharacterized caspase-like protein
MRTVFGWGPNVSRLVLGWFVALLILTVAQPSAAGENRVALVIGIGDYKDPLLGKLDHPKPDADAVAQKLGALGFNVVEAVDRTKQQLLTVLDVFVHDHRGAEAVLVYFTGHGLQIGGQNFLLPTDANFDTTATLQTSAVPLEEIFARAAKVAPSRIILLDACRDDPTHRASTVRKDPTRPIVSGLGRVGGADGTIYAFSTAPGATAEDGSGDHSPFAQALLAHLGEKGLAFSEVMKLVQMEVYDQTPEHQLPYIEDALPSLIFVARTNGDALSERDRLLLAMAKIDPDTRAQVERLAKAKDVPLAPLYGALFAGAAQADARDGETRERVLRQAAEDFIKVRTELKTLASSDPEVARLRAEADQDLSLGALEAARAALTRAIAVDADSGEKLEARLKERKLSEAASHAARAGILRTHLEYRAAANDLAAAVALAEQWNNQELAWRYTLEQANDLRTVGDEFADNAALDEAIKLYARALTLAPRTSRASDWATTQSELGNALRILGDRESGRARLEAAIAADGEALKERSRDRVPLDWARTQTNLGMALKALGARESGTTRLAEAVAAFREALKEETRARAARLGGGTARPR